MAEYSTYPGSVLQERTEPAIIKEGTHGRVQHVARVCTASMYRTSHNERRNHGRVQHVVRVRTARMYRTSYNERRNPWQSTALSQGPYCKNVQNQS